MDDNYKSKSFWRKPEGVTGALVMGGIALGAGFLLINSIGAIIAATSSMLGLAGIIGVLGVLVYMALDSKARNLVWYIYKSTMRWITGLFVQIDPIAILKNYVDEMSGNLKKMNKQILQLRGQMHKLKELILNNQKEISSNLSLANEAKEVANKQVVILKSRKAGRLKQSNMKLEDLYGKMEVLYRVLKKMYENSEILKEDVSDQVEIKAQEMQAMKASHSAMNSAMSVIRGDSDKRAMFEMALEVVADDVSAKVGEMERFMEMSESFMGSIDLQNGIFEEEGLKMLEKWEKENSLLLMDEKDTLLLEDGAPQENTLDINESMVSVERVQERVNQYDNLFE
ncbi:MAG: hypothetical protein ACI9FN_002865 [Saprospiraceae bacterium]|jgi:hypothetical protein